MIELDKDNFDAKVLESKGIVVVDFWGPTCGRCIDMMPKVEEVAAEFAGKAEFGKVNIMGNRRLAMREQVMGLPTILIYRDGKKVESLVVEFTVDDLRNKLKELAG